MTPRYAREDEIAKILKTAPKTLANWRSVGFGPPWYRIGKRGAVYDVDEVLAWLKARRVAVE